MNQEAVGKFIAGLRREKNMTQEALGCKIGVTNKTVSRWENGNYMPDIEMLQILGAEFDIGVDELLRGRRDGYSSSGRGVSPSETEEPAPPPEDSPFSVKENIKFWEKKWIKERTAFLIFIVIAALASIAAARHIFGLRWILISPIVFFVLCGAIKNRKAAYAEEKVFGVIPPKTP